MILNPYAGAGEARRTLASFLRIALFVFAGLATVAARADDGPAVKDPKAAPQVLQPAAPALSDALIAAIQEGKHAEAVAALQTLAAKAQQEDKAYYEMLQGIVHRVAGKLNEARGALEAALKTQPQGVWSAKARFELATVELAAGNPGRAEALAREQAESLLGGERKDRLARVYEEVGSRLLNPDGPIPQSDPEAAYALFEQALRLAKGEKLRQDLLRGMGIASQKANNHPRAIVAFEQYSREFPKGAFVVEIRYRQAESKFAAGDLLGARLIWSDLVRDQAQPRADVPEADAAFRARAMYRIADTHGIPQPGDDTQLNLGIAALRRYLAEYPKHEWSAQASYRVGASYLHRGKSQEAIEAFRAFLKGEGFSAETESAKRDVANLSMSAAFQIGQILQTQEKFTDAIAAYKGYLAQYPNGPQSADAQRAILDVQLAIADEHLRFKRYEQARAAWTAFINDNPLDARAPQLLHQIGQSFAAEKKFDQALASWETLIGKFPQTEPAAHAQFDAALIYETEKGDLEAAIERYRKIAVSPWKEQGARRVAVMESKVLTVVTPRVFRTGENPELKIATRNLENLVFTAYKLDAEAYFRKKHAVEKVEDLDISLVAPDAEWSVGVKEYAKHKLFETPYKLEKLTAPGVWVVKVTDEKHLQATTLVLCSDVDAIIKSSRDQSLIFVQDMKTGKGRPNARVFVSDGSKIIKEGKTGADGVLLESWAQPLDPNRDLDYLVVDAGHVAGTGLAIPGQVAQGLTARAYIYTDRPAYRPGQEVAVRGVVREIVDGQYSHQPSAEYRLEVYDARGRMIVKKSVKLSEFGAFSEKIAVDSGAPVGSYRIRLYQPGKSEFSGEFLVQSYALQKVDLTLDLSKTIYFRGETIKGTAIAKYQYGTPLSNRPIRMRLPDGRMLDGRTDASGKFPFEFPTQGFAEEQTLALAAQLPQDNVSTALSVFLAVREYNLGLSSSRSVYLAGEPFRLEVQANRVDGGPIGADLTVTTLKRVEQGGRTAERQIAQVKLAVDAKTGKGDTLIKIDDESGGSFVVRVAGVDRFGNPIVADREFTISGKSDETKLRILADRTVWKVGEKAKVIVHSRDQGADPAASAVLYVWEADRVLKHQIAQLKEGENELTWDIDGKQFPNFTLTASRMVGSRFDNAALDVTVSRDLRVAVAPAKPKVSPGEEFEVEVTTTDQLGRPVSAEVSLAMVDKALLRLYQDSLPSIDSFFYSQSRTNAFSARSTNVFKYEPPTTAVAEAIVEDAERDRLLVADDFDRKEMFKKELSDQVVRLYDAEQPLAEARKNDAPAPAMMPGMAGSGPRGGAGGMPGTPRRRAESSRMLGAMGEEAAQEQTEEKLSRAKLAADPQSANLFAEYDFDDSVALGGRLARAKGLQSPRRKFVETAYWNPEVVTDAQGKAKIKIKAPTALSDYRFSARGVSARETLVGQADAELAVRKDFFVDLKAPTIFTEGDKPRLRAEVHHVGVAGELDLRLTVYSGGGRDHVDARRIALKGDGVTEVLFDPFEVLDGDSARINLKGTIGQTSDELFEEISIRPWGLQAIASASGSATNDATVFVGLPEGRVYDHPEMLITLSPSVKRMIFELAMGGEAFGPSRLLERGFPTPRTTADRASELLAACAAYEYLIASKATNAPEATRLGDRISGLVAELISTQGEDGGWSWVGGAQDGKARDFVTNAQVFWALTAAERLGMVPNTGSLDLAANALTQVIAQARGDDYETRMFALHVLSERGRAPFEAVNSLNRVRTALSNASLARLALTLAKLDRKPMANEALTILAQRAKRWTNPAGVAAGLYWEGKGQASWQASDAETTALAALAFAAARPESDESRQAIAWLEAHRDASGWNPSKAKGPALAALAAYYGRAQAADDRFRLAITVNGQEVHRKDYAGSTEGEAIVVPARLVKLGGGNAVRFDIEGRATYGYSVTLSGFSKEFGPDQDRRGKTSIVKTRDYVAANPEFEGRTLPVGFSAAVDPTTFVNKITQVELGGRGRVQLDLARDRRSGQPLWEDEFLIVEEHLPAGVSVVEGSIQSNAAFFTQGDGLLTFYYPPGVHPGEIRYETYGYLPGEYRALPTRIRSAYEPGRTHLGPVGTLKVLAPGEASTDPYKPTPDELLARGTMLFDGGRRAEAAKSLEPLFEGYVLQAQPGKDVPRMLLFSYLEPDNFQARKVVRYFEVLKEKAPELEVPFGQILRVGRAYRDIEEFERAYLVWRAIADASYLDDVKVAQVLRARGKSLEGAAMLIRLWREYPNTESIQADFFGLSQFTASLASRGLNDAAIRRELAEAGVSRAQLYLQSIRLTEIFLTQSPKNPLADEASLALLGSYLELEDYKGVVEKARRFAKLYPKSSYLDSFQFSEALGRFQLGEYDRAIEVAKTIADAVYKGPDGADKPSPNKWQAVYILGQIHDARRQPGQALEYYKQVADKFSDAGLAVAWLTRKDLSLPEISMVRPAAKDGAIGLRAIGLQPDASDKPEVKIDYRNIAKVDVKVYPVDLMRLYLTRRNLQGVAGIDLAGITPLHETTIELGDGKDFEEKIKTLPLPLQKEGAYLVMARGEDLYASGIVLVSPIEMQVQEEAASGQARITVRDARTKEALAKVQVKAIGTGNDRFISGETDRRGVFVAEGLRGVVTAICRRDVGQFAFHRGTVALGSPPVSSGDPRPAKPQEPAPASVEPAQSLDANVRYQNDSNRMRQIERLENRFKQQQSGVQIQGAQQPLP